MLNLMSANVTFLPRSLRRRKPSYYSSDWVCMLHAHVMQKALLKGSALFAGGRRHVYDGLPMAPVSSAGFWHRFELL